MLGWQSMRVLLKGINRTTKRLADGRRVTYWYAWRGGPRLDGEPGSPEFIASYNAAVARKVQAPRGAFQSIIDAYQQSQAFRELRPRTQKDYVWYIAKIEKKFADFPIAALPDKRTRGVFMTWRDNLAASSPRVADYSWAVLARILSWAFDRGLVDANPCKEGRRAYRGSRADKVWSDDDEAHFLAKAPARLHLPLLLALWTGQRQGDLLRLPWSAYDGTHIRLRQSKTGRRVLIPVGAPLKAVLDAAAKVKTGPIILHSAAGRPWTSASFKSAWGRACIDIGIKDITFHDLRGTAVTRLALAECTEIEIASITGHTLHEVNRILDAHYLHRDPKLAENAIRKLEEKRGYAHGSGTNLQTELQTAQIIKAPKTRKAE
jgi:integrase